MNDSVRDPRSGGAARLLCLALLFVFSPQACVCQDREVNLGGPNIQSGERQTPGARSPPARNREVLSSGLVMSPGDPGKTDVLFTVHGRRDPRPISPYIYGVNAHCDPGEALRRPRFIRLGGNRWTAYNWTNNASNAGSDYQHQNDGWLGGGDRPGGAILEGVDRALGIDAAALVTIPITDWVAADKEGGGDVNGSGAEYLSRRFVRSSPRKGLPFTYPPAKGSAVYQDEMVHWLERSRRRSSSQPIFYALDNEPGLWSTTHPRIRPDPVTYAELIERSITYARAIKDVAPEAKIFGPVSYGWLDFTTLQRAPDSRGRDFLDVYLQAMRRASEEEERRLLDVLTVHWYPEVLGGRERITGQGTGKAVVEARVQAPRSLWDPRHMEDSWIARRSIWGPIRLLPRLRARIEASYPGTELAITEYNYGGGGHISGGIAQADVLGIFGREGVFAASVWTFGKGPSDYIFGAMSMFVDFDGEGASFGDTSIHARTTDPAATSVYASLDSSRPGRMVLVAINKTEEPVTAGLKITYDHLFDGGRLFRQAQGSPRPTHAGRLENTADNAFRIHLPPMSVSTLELVATGE